MKTQWEKSHHARSIIDIFMDRYLQKGVLSVKTPRDATKKNFPCFQCNLSQLEYPTDKVASEIAAAILGNLKHWLEETPEIIEITESLPDIRSANSCRT